MASQTSSMMPLDFLISLFGDNQSDVQAAIMTYNSTSNGVIFSNATHFDLINNKIIQATFCLLYAAIFILGIFGNVLVCYVVFKNKAMQTVTNLFITNLALSDILLCVLAIPFTPLYTFLRKWVFGTLLCHLVPYAQGCSVYISTLTLTSIAIDRFFVIIYPFHPRMKLSTCILIICSIWMLALILMLPYGLFRQVFVSDFSGTMRIYCEEDWPSEYYRKIFGSVTSMLQFVLPFTIISICYICVSIRLTGRAKSKPGTKTSRREEADRDRKKRTNRMLIAMVSVFGLSWLPLNVVNVLNDFYAKTDEWKFYNFLFFIAHSIAMSSTCYNPFLYAWLNENFRKEFKQVLPCFNPSRSIRNSVESHKWQPEQTYNGNNETIQESFLTSRASISQLHGSKDTTTTTTAATSAGNSNNLLIKSPTNTGGFDGGVEQTILLSDIGSINNSKILTNTAADNSISSLSSSTTTGKIATTKLNNSIKQLPETKILPSGVLETNFEENLVDEKKTIEVKSSSSSSSSSSVITKTKGAAATTGKNMKLSFAKK